MGDNVAINTAEIRATVLYDICSSAIDDAGCAEKNRAIEDLCVEVERLRKKNDDLASIAGEHYANSERFELALDEIACQCPTDEMEGDEHKDADFEGAYDVMIRVARFALHTDASSDPDASENPSGAKLSVSIQEGR